MQIKKDRMEEQLRLAKLSQSMRFQDDGRGRLSHLYKKILTALHRQRKVNEWLCVHSRRGGCIVLWKGHFRAINMLRLLQAMKSCSDAGLTQGHTVYLEVVSICVMVYWYRRDTWLP